IPIYTLSLHDALPIYQVTLMKLDGTEKNFRVTKLFGFLGLERVEINEAKAGELIAVSGMEDIFVGETVVDSSIKEALDPLRIDEDRKSTRLNSSHVSI